MVDFFMVNVGRYNSPMDHLGRGCMWSKIIQWIFQVPVKGGRWHIIPQLAVYTTYIPLELRKKPPTLTFIRALIWSARAKGKCWFAKDRESKNAPRKSRKMVCICA